MKQQPASDSQLPFQNKILILKENMSASNHQTFNDFFMKERAKKEDVDEEEPNMLQNNRKTRTRLDPKLFFEQINSTEIQKIPKQKKNPFKQLFLPKTIKGSIEKWRGLTYFRPWKQLAEFHYNVISDNAYIIPLKIGKRLFSEILLVWTPLHPFIILTKLLSFIFLICLQWEKPFEMSFYNFLGKASHQFFSSLFLVYFAFEICCKLNTGYFLNGILVKKRTMIFRNYLKNFLFADILCLLIFSMDYMEASDGTTYTTKVHIIKLGVLFKASQFKSLYLDLVQYFKIDYHLKSYIELYITLLVAHIIACLWHYSALLSEEFMPLDQNWLSYADLTHENVLVQYLYSFYFAVVVMMTVGFGDITPRNPIEVVFCIFIIIVGCALYGYNLNSIGIILQKINKEQTEFTEKMRIIQNFMEKKKIDNNLHTRIKEYLKFVWNEKKSNQNEEEMEIINSLSSTLREELLLESYRGIITALPLLKTFFSESTLKKMVSLVKEVHFVPGDRIFIVFIM